MRKVNNRPEDEESSDSKSINVTGGKSGVIYPVNLKESGWVVVAEGEADYVVLRML